MLDTLVCAGVTLCSLRATCLAGATLCFLGAAVRCFPLDAAASTGMIHLGQFFNGLAGPIAMAAGPVLSATWFPPQQRTTATAIQAMSNYIGGALPFLLGPALVSDHTVASNKHNMKTEILHYMWMHAAFAAVVLVATIVYFPSHPPNAPSRSAETSRVSFVSGLKQLMLMRQFWYIMLAYGMMTGVCSG